jgi:DNA-binding PadR family transcriptional regulator
VRNDLLGIFEFKVLSALVRPSQEAYGAEIQQLLQERAGKPVSIGAIYTALDRLETKGFIKSRWGEPTAVRGGRRRRYYRLQAEGVSALNRTKATWRENAGLFEDGKVFA